LVPLGAESVEQCFRGTTPNGTSLHLDRDPELLFLHVCVRADHFRFRAGVRDDRVPERDYPLSPQAICMDERASICADMGATDLLLGSQKAVLNLV
jgi:hypothetical protein